MGAAEVVEVMARAICGSLCEWGPDRIMLGGSGVSGHMTQPFERPLWRDFVPDAEAAIAALSAAGYEIVKRDLYAELLAASRAANKEGV
jgi:hypothetical protein